MGCKRSEVQILSPRLVGTIPENTAISRRYGGVFLIAPGDELHRVNPVICRYTVEKFLERSEGNGITFLEGVAARTRIHVTPHEMP
jgi:hypothetical protein